MKNLSLLLLAICAFAMFGCKTAEPEVVAEPAPAAETPAVEVEVEQPAPQKVSAGVQKNADGSVTFQMTEVK